MIKRTDVIIDPTDPRVEGLIGKRVHMGNSWLHLMNSESLYRLARIAKNSSPFQDSVGTGYTMIAPIPEPTYQELQAEWLEKNALKIGDSVKVTSIKNSPPRFCGNGTKSSIIGTIRKIIKVVPDQITIDGVDGWEEAEAWYMSYKDLEPAKSQYRPFKSPEEFTPFRDKWIVGRGDAENFFRKVVDYGPHGITISDSDSKVGDVKFICYPWEVAFEDFCFEDGTPFGVKESKN